jgi:hypothetical protein
VIDDRSAGAADGIETLLGNAGFDVSPGIWLASDAPEQGSGTATILYAPGHDREASVLSKYLPGIVVEESSSLRGVPVAVVITAGYEQVVPADDVDASQCPAA